MVIFHSYVSFPEAKSHEIPFNHHSTTIFLWFFHSFATHLPQKGHMPRGFPWAGDSPKDLPADCAVRGAVQLGQCQDQPV